MSSPPPTGHFAALRQLLSRISLGRKSLWASAVAVVGVVSGVLGIWDFVSERNAPEEVPRVLDAIDDALAELRG